MTEEEERQARIRQIVERSQTRNICPVCGYPKFTGAIHAYGGNWTRSKEETTWCNGSRKIPKVSERVRKKDVVMHCGEPMVEIRRDTQFMLCQCGVCGRKQRVAHESYDAIGE